MHTWVYWSWCLFSSEWLLNSEYLATSCGQTQGCPKNSAREWSLKVLFLLLFPCPPCKIATSSPPSSVLCPTPALHPTGRIRCFRMETLEFLSNMCPSAQEELGNERLDKARDLAMRNEALASPRDLAIAKEIFMLYQGCSQHTSAPRTSRRGWDQKETFLDSYKRGNTTRLPNALFDLSRSLSPVHRQLEQPFSRSHNIIYRLSPQGFKMKCSDSSRC